jgi:hypothetical protein
LTIAGFNAKPSAIELKDLQGLGANSVSHIGKPFAAPAAIVALAILADQRDIGRFRAEFLIA